MASTPECPALSEEDVKYLDNISYWYPFNSNLQGLSYKNVVWKNAKATYLLAFYERSWNESPKNRKNKLNFFQSGSSKYGNLKSA